MNQKAVWQEFMGLPPDARRQVTDFIAFLRARHVPSHPRRIFKKAPLKHESFIGLWRDREDLRDSCAWVRKTRERDWMKPRA